MKKTDFIKQFHRSGKWIPHLAIAGIIGLLALLLLRGVAQICAGAFIACVFVVGVILTSRPLSRYRCPKCRASLNTQPYIQIAVATGHCGYCGEPVFEEEEAENDKKVTEPPSPK